MQSTIVFPYTFYPAVYSSRAFDDSATEGYIWWKIRDRKHVLVLTWKPFKRHFAWPYPAIPHMHAYFLKLYHVPDELD